VWIAGAGANFGKWSYIPALVSAPHQTVCSGKILRTKQILALESAALTGRRQAPAVISHFGLLVGPGRPWSALVGSSRLHVGVSRYREATKN
jgi:hypothetical protein